MATRSQFLSGRQLSAINKVGDAMLPGDIIFPSFSALGCVKEVDRLLAHMPPGDRNDLKTLLSFFSFLPKFFIRAILLTLEFAFEKNLPMGGILRLVRMGLRGVVMSLYYGDPMMHEKIDYKVEVYTADLN